TAPRRSGRPERPLWRADGALGRGVGALVGDPAPRGLGCQLDRLARARGVRLHVGEAAGLVVEGDAQLALLDALVEPGAAEHQAPEPVDQRALGRSDELRPAVVDVFAQRRGRVDDLAVDGQVDEVFELLRAEAAGHEAELQGGLLAAL